MNNMIKGDLWWSCPESEIIMDILGPSGQSYSDLQVNHYGTYESNHIGTYGSNHSGTFGSNHIDISKILDNMLDPS